MTNRMTAEELLLHFSDLIQQQFNAPVVVDDEANQALLQVGDPAVENAGQFSAPWENVTSKDETNMLFKMPADVVAKMDWVIDNVLRMSKQRIVRDAVNAYLNNLIAQHHKPT